MSIDLLKPTRHAFLAGLLLAVSGVCSADARIGDTREVAAGQGGRYGVPTGETTPALEGSKERVDIFRKGDITITAEYDKTDTIWRLTFEAKNLTEKDIQELLSKSGSSLVWAKPMEFYGNKYFTTTDRSMHAAYYDEPNFKLVIMSKAALLAERLPQELTGREEKENATTSGEAEEPGEAKKSRFEDF